ncbi:MAG: hypothetical protein KTR31_31795 [Myxococcales bacterium]|nr:hypothetical protein [Myxococcales bacterium]
MQIRDELQAELLPGEFVKRIEVPPLNTVPPHRWAIALPWGAIAPTDPKHTELASGWRRFT